MEFKNCCRQNCMHNIETKCNMGFLFNAGECSNYMDYRDQEKYKSKYWTAQYHSSTGKYFKRYREGLRIELCGMVFYTQDNTNQSYMCNLTEASSGRYAGLLCDIDKNITKIRKVVKLVKDVTSLPLKEELEIYYE